MKICIVLPEYLPVPAVKGGAVETLVEDIIRVNEKYKKLDIVCISKKDKDAEYFFQKFSNTKFLTISFFNSKIDFIFKAINFILRKILKIDIRKRIRIKKYNEKILSDTYDLIIFEGVNNYINKELVKKIGKEKLILHLHKVYEPNLEWKEYFENFISLSEYATNEFCKNDIISRDKVQTLLNGVNIEKFTKRINNHEIMLLKQKYKIRNDELIILYTGRLLQEKGVKELILAFKEMKNKKNCRLIIVGSAVSSDNSETQYTRNLKLLAKNENITFTGYIPNDELYKFYALADIAVYPSTGQEGLGLVVIEAMSCGLPTIITKSGGMPELVTDETSKIVELDENLIKNLSNEMEKLSIDIETRNKMGSKAIERAKKFNSENYYLGYVRCLENVKTKINKGLKNGKS